MMDATTATNADTNVTTTANVNVTNANNITTTTNGNRRSYDQCRNACRIGRERRDLLLSQGACIIHPIKDSNIETSKRCKRIVKLEHKETFKNLADAFIRYHSSQGKCYNYNNRKYQTTCSCLKSLSEGANAEDKIQQASESIYQFFSRPANTQKLMVKDWIRNALVIKSTQKTSCFKVSTNFLFPGVYEDAPINKKFFMLCQNAVMLLFNYGYFKFCKLKKDLENPGVIPHGNINRMPSEKFREIATCLHKFFGDIREEAEIAREANHYSLREGEFDTVELPSTLTKRQLYARFCYERGWVVHSDNKGNLGKVKNYPVRPVSDDWPEGSVPKKVPSRPFFENFWKDNYPNIKISPRSPQI